MTETTPTREIMRAYRFTLDPTTTQLQALNSHAGSARWAFNHALEAKIRAHEQWKTEVTAKIAAGVDEPTARRTTRVPIPMKPAIQKALNAIKGDATKGVDGPCDWWREVSTYAFQSAFADADTAWKNWLASLRGTRAGRPVGYPRRKIKHKARPSFRIHHDVTKPTIRVATYRRLLIPRLGELRIHDSAKRLHRAVAAGTAVIQSVTISQSGARWYASVLVRENQPAAVASKAQRVARTVGVDIGVRHLAALSTGELVANPRTKRAHARALVKAGRAYARTQKGSRRRNAARRRLARLQHLEARHRAGVLHSLTKRLATSWATVAIEDLHVAGMTRSARGTAEKPGRNVRAKTGLNRSLLDVSPGELRRQLTYKTSWYGSQLAVLDRWWPSSKTCSACGTAKAKLPLSERTFHCDNCNSVPIDRDVNAAINIARHAVIAASTDVAPSIEETQNARRAGMRPTHPRVATQPAMKREDTAKAVPPPGSDARTVPTAA